MDFVKYANEYGEVATPFGKKHPGTDWEGGVIEAKWLNNNFAHCADLDECITSTDSEGLKLFFEYLKAQQ